MANQVQDFNCK